MIVIHPTRAGVSVAEPQPYFLTVLFVDSMVTGNCVTARTIFRAKDGHPIQGISDFTSICSAFVGASRLWTICITVPSLRIIGR